MNLLFPVPTSKPQSKRGKKMSSTYSTSGSTSYSPIIGSIVAATEQQRPEEVETRRRVEVESHHTYFDHDELDISMNATDCATEDDAIFDQDSHRIDISTFEVQPRSVGTVGRAPSPLPAENEHMEHQEPDRLCLQPPTGQAALSAPVRPLKLSAQGLWTPITPRVLAGGTTICFCKIALGSPSSCDGAESGLRQQSPVHGLKDHKASEMRSATEGSVEGSVEVRLKPHALS